MAFDPIFARELLKTIAEGIGPGVSVEANLTGKEDEFDVIVRRGASSAPVRLTHDEMIGAMGMGWNTEPIRLKLEEAAAKL